MDAKEWLEECNRNYEKLLPQLQNEYRGMHVAFDGEKVIGAGSNPHELIERLALPGASRFELYFVNDNSIEEIDSDDLVIPDRRL